MKEPAIVVPKEIYEKYCMMGIEILPDVFIVSYLSERQAKNDAHFLNVPFVRVDAMNFLGLKDFDGQ